MLVGYLLVGEFAYVAHPHAPSDKFNKFNKFNMLTAYSTHDGTMLAATALAGVSALVTYPVSHFVSRAALDDVYVAMAGKERAFPGRAPLKRHVGQTVVFVGMTTATALLVRDLGVVFRVLGSIGGSLVVFILPGILLLSPKYHAVGIDVDGSVGDGDGDTQGADFGGRVPTGETGDEEAAHGHRRVRSRHWTEMGDMGLNPHCWPEPQAMVDELRCEARRRGMPLSTGPLATGYNYHSTMLLGWALRTKWRCIMVVWEEGESG